MSTLLIDGTNLLMRGFFASRKHTLTGWIDGKEIDTGAMYLWIKMVSKYVREYEPTRFLSCWDTRGDTTWRSRIYPDYKDGRKPRDGDEAERVMMRFCVLGRVPHVATSGFEADDLLAAALAEIRTGPVRIISADADLLQLVDSGHPERPVTVIRPGQKVEEWGDAEVIEKYGVPPKVLPFYRALVGDKSDNLPGVQGIGPKKAAKLLDGVTEPSADLASEIMQAVSDPVYPVMLRLTDLGQSEVGRVRVPYWSPTRPRDTLAEPLKSFLRALRMQTVVADFEAGRLWTEQQPTSG